MVRTHALNRDERVQRARDTVNKLVPEYLRTSPRARHGIHKSVAIADPEPRREDSPTGDMSHYAKTRIRVRDIDTLSAARRMTYTSRRASVSAHVSREQATRRVANVCILNQASAIKPGGGFLDGVHSQEEFLCQRSTLYASLWDSLYPLPEIGGVFSSDILVFGDSTPEADEVSKRDRIYVDVISASMIRFPGAPRWRQDGEEVRPGCSCGVSYCDQDRDVVTSKMQGVLRIAQAKGVEKLVLGAWGCGAYGNPPKEVARLWKKAICGTSRSPVSWPGIKEIVFAITDRPALKEFEKCFADVIATSEADRSPPPERMVEPEAIAEDQVQDLIAEIQETEMQLAQLQNPRTRGRLRDKLTNLNKQLTELGTAESPKEDSSFDEDSDGDFDDDFVVQGYPASDNEDNSYYNFDENDVASSSSATPASTYEFRFDLSSPARQNRPRRGSGPGSPILDEGFVHATAPRSVDSSPTRGSRAGPAPFERVVEDRRRLDESGGWFSGSVNELSALLKKTGAAGADGCNPALSPAEPRPEDAAFPEF